MQNPMRRPAPSRPRGGAPAPIIQHAGEHFSNIMGVRRRGKFVGYGTNLFVLLRALDHGVDETRPVRAKHPGYPHNKMPILSCKHILFSRKLRFAVSADRIRLILFCVRRAFLPAENIISTEVNQLCLFFVADFGKNTRRFRVNPKRAIALGFASIDFVNAAALIKTSKFIAPSFPRTSSNSPGQAERD
jgi:hypothetical protein